MPQSEAHAVLRKLSLVDVKVRNCNHIERNSVPKPSLNLIPYVCPGTVRLQLHVFDNMSGLNPDIGINRKRFDDAFRFQTLQDLNIVKDTKRTQTVIISLSGYKFMIKRFKVLILQMTII